MPFKRYVFLFACRGGGGGLEHLNSTLVTTNAAGLLAVYTPCVFRLVKHEYVHAFNVKRLRPVELGPFDYEKEPTTPSLWISEGLTSYYGDLGLARAGLDTPEGYLARLSGKVTQLQNSPGRLLQSLEQSSKEVWRNSNSGIGANAKTVSYYVKGNVVAFLLDAHIRRLTNGAKSLDDGIRLAYSRYGGDRGFTAAELRATFEEVAGANLKPWFTKAIGTAGELDYGEMLALVRATLRRRGRNHCRRQLGARSPAARDRRPAQTPRRPRRATAPVALTSSTYAGSRVPDRGQTPHFLHAYPHDGSTKSAGSDVAVGSASPMTMDAPRDARDVGQCTFCETLHCGAGAGTARVGP